MTLIAPVPPRLTALVRALERDVQAELDLDAGVPAALWERALLGPAREFLSRPGKELRGKVVQAGWLLGGGAPADPPEPLALVVEALHAGSLIVDDVEDDSDERRGAPALHRVVGTPLAINTGNWMYFWAFALLGRAGLSTAAHAAASAATARTLLACHHGQALDLSVRIGDLSAADAPAVVAATTRLKTGALMGLAARLGAIGAGAPAPAQAAIAALGEAVGVGLQMLDDLGSVCSKDRIAKGREDLRGGRPTWPWAWLAAHADDLVWARLHQRSRAAVGGADAECDALADALRREVEPHGRRAVRAHLDGALAAAEAALGRSLALDFLRAELRRMEESYG